MPGRPYRNRQGGDEVEKYGIVFLYLRISDQKWQAMVSCNGGIPLQQVPGQLLGRVIAVSYTHLDVYKRQVNILHIINLTEL